MNKSQVECHPLWQKWRELHQAKMVLLGGDLQSIGFISHVLNLGKERFDIDTLEPVSDDEWDARFNLEYGASKFEAWLLTQVTTGGNDETT